MIVKNPAGTTVLTLGDTAVVGGYLATLYDESDRTFRRVTVSNPVVDGDAETQAVLNGQTVTVQVYIEGTSWADATAKRAALIAAVEVHHWQLTVGSVTWVCRKADSASPIPPGGTASTWRVVTLTIPVELQMGV